MNGSSDPTRMQNSRRKLTRFFSLGFLLILVLGIAGVFYVKTHPVVFNESFFGHAHCIAAAVSTLHVYAKDHEGRFPFHTNGFGDALILLLRSEASPNPSIISGANDDGSIFREAIARGTDVREEFCSRIYVQGLCATNDLGIAILFDARPSPGGDHCHLWRRIVASPTREVAFVDGHRENVRENAWPQFAANQIDLLVQAGFGRSNAEAIYTPTLKPPVKSPSP